MLSYGIFRFIIEFFRGDDRGELLSGVLSPSQIVSILLAVGAAVLYFVTKKKSEECAN